MKTETPKLTLTDTKALRVIVATQQAVLDAQSKAILIAYATHLSKTRADWDSWPGLTTLALYTGLSPDTITRTRRYLVEQKLLIPRPRHPGQKIPKDGGRPAHASR